MSKHSRTPGISKVNKRWRSIVQYDGNRYHLGYFNTEQEAIDARNQKRKELGICDYVEDLPDEVWAYSPSLGEGYAVSNMGRFKSLNFRHEGREKLLKEHLCSMNPNYLVLSTNDGGYFSHRLVMEAFHGASDLQVNHLNKKTFDNRLSNLEYVTNRENGSHAVGGAKGCTYTRGRWMAAIRLNGLNINLGYYNTYKEAHQRYINALQEYGLVNKYVRDTV